MDTFLIIAGAFLVGAFFAGWFVISALRVKNGPAP